MTTWGELEMKHDKFVDYLQDKMDWEGEDKEEYEKKVKHSAKMMVQAQRALSKSLKASSAKPNSKQAEIDGYEYKEWSDTPFKVYEDGRKVTYDEARVAICSLDKEKGAWLTPLKGHCSANKTSGSKQIHRGGLQLWLKKYKGSWAIYLGQGQTPDELIGAGTSLDDPYITLEQVLQDVLSKASVTMDQIKEVLLPVKTTNELALRIEKVKQFDKKQAIAWLRDFGAFDEPEPGNMCGATAKTPEPPTKKVACAMLVHMLSVELSFSDPDEDTVYWAAGTPLPTA